MDETISAAKANRRLYLLLRAVRAVRSYVVTRHGKPEAVMLSEEDYESLLETLDILSDQKLARDIKKAQQDLKAGKGISWNKAKKKLGYAV